MTMPKAVLAMALIAAVAGCTLSDPRAGASISVGSGGVSVSPHVGVGIGRARVGVGL